MKRVRPRLSSASFFRRCLISPALVPLLCLIPPLTPFGLFLGMGFALVCGPYIAIAIPLAWQLPKWPERRQIGAILAFPIVVAAAFVPYFALLSGRLGDAVGFAAFVLFYGYAYTVAFLTIYAGLRNHRVRPDPRL